MSVTDYADTPGGNAAGLFPEGMPRNAVNNGARIVQADLRQLANGLPFFDIGTGSGPANYSFVSSTSFTVDNADVVAFYTAGRRLRVSGVAAGTIFATVDSAVFTAPSTLITFIADGGAPIANEELKVALSIVDPTSVPATVSAPNLLLTSTNPSADSGPIVELFRDSASPAADDLLGKVVFTGRDASGTKLPYCQIAAEIDDPADGSEDTTLRITQMRNGSFDDVARFSAGQAVVQRSDSSSLRGPAVRLSRTSSSPADDDELGYIEFLGRDTAGNEEAYGRIQSQIRQSGNGTEGGRFLFTLLGEGAEKEVANWSTNRARFTSRVVVINDDTVLDLQKTGGNGTMVRFIDGGGKTEGSIALNGNTVSYNTFTGSHWSEFGIFEEIDPPEGTLLSTYDGWFDQQKGLPLVEVSKKPMDRCIYGVFGGRSAEEKCAHVYSLGTAPKVRCIGPIQNGDLLTSSDFPGVAIRQDDDVFRASTLGKAVVTDLRVTERLIAANIMAG